MAGCCSFPDFEMWHCSVPRTIIGKLVTLGGVGMLRTIIIGSCVSVQGLMEKTLPDGRISVRVGDSIFVGMPVSGTA